MRATWPRSFETVEHSPHKREASVQWILLQVSSDIQLMFCRIFIFAIGGGDLQSHVTVGIPPPSVKTLGEMHI